jgi:hypothetical protein
MKNDKALKEIALLASIAVYDADCSPRYSADEMALALIKLVDVAVNIAVNGGDLSEITLFVALGCFHRTREHGLAVDAFKEKGLSFDLEQLSDKGQHVLEMWRRRGAQ